MKDQMMIRQTYDLWKTSYPEDPQTIESDCPKCDETEMVIIMFDPITEQHTLECPGCGDTFKRDALA
jgi:transcription elongation factor Elf1